MTGRVSAERTRRAPGEGLHARGARRVMGKDLTRHRTRHGRVRAFSLAPACGNMFALTAIANMACIRAMPSPSSSSSLLCSRVLHLRRSPSSSCGTRRHRGVGNVSPVFSQRAIHVPVGNVSPVFSQRAIHVPVFSQWAIHIPRGKCIARFSQRAINIPHPDIA